MSTVEQKTKTLKNLKRFELINRLAFYACLLPFFHTAACLGQKQSIPLASKVGSVGFVASVVIAATIRHKEEKTQEELDKIACKKRNSRC